MAPKVTAKIKLDGENIAAQLDDLGRLARFGNSLGGVGAAISAVITAPLALLAAPALAAAAAHREAVNSIRIATGATGARLDALGGIMEDVRRTARAGCGEAADAVAALSAALDIAGDDLRDASAALIRLARAGGEEVKVAAGSVAKTLRAFGVDGHASAHAMDTLRSAAQIADGGLAGLTGQLTAAAPALKACGLTLDQSAALLGDLALRGVPTDEALSGLQKALLKLTKQDAATAGRALFEHIEAIRRAPSEAESARLSAELFGKRSLLMGDAIRHGALSLTTINRLVANAPAAAPPVRGIGKALTDLRIAIEQAILPLGQALETVMLPALRAGAAAIGRAIDLAGRVAHAFGELPGWLRSVIVIVAGLAALAGPALFFFGSVLVPAAEALAVGVAAIGSTGLVGTALAALAGGALLGLTTRSTRLAGAVKSAAAIGVPAVIIAAAAAIGADHQAAAATVGAAVHAATSTINAAAGVALAKAVPPAPSGGSAAGAGTSSGGATFDHAFDWAQKFHDAAAVVIGPDGAPRFNIPDYRDVRTAHLAGADAATLLQEIGQLKGVRFDTMSNRIDAELRRAQAMLTPGDSMRLHAMEIAGGYAALTSWLVGPAIADGAIDTNSPAAWMARADEMDRLTANNAARDQYAIQLHAENDAYWMQETSATQEYWVNDAREQQFALTHAGIRPNVYLPEGIIAAVQQGWEAAAAHWSPSGFGGAAATFGGARAGGGHP